MDNNNSSEVSIPSDLSGNGLSKDDDNLVNEVRNILI